MTLPQPSDLGESAVPTTLAARDMLSRVHRPGFGQPYPAPHIPVAGNPVLAAFRLALYALWVLALTPVQMLAMATGWSLKKRLPRFFHRVSHRILGIRTVVTGAPVATAPALIVANHSGYLDIPVLGALLEAGFVAKAEVRGWPVFGWLAMLQGSSFIDRRRTATSTERNSLADRLAAGDSLILFPEGTSSDGNRTLTFKSALLSVAELEPNGKPLIVQPVSVAYTRLDGVPLGRGLRPFYAWYGDMELAGHLWRVLGLGVVTVEVQFHEPVTLAQLGSRKALAAYCQRVVAAGVSAALSGRGGATPSATQTGLVTQPLVPANG